MNMTSVLCGKKICSVADHDSKKGSKKRCCILNCGYKKIMRLFFAVPLSNEIKLFLNKIIIDLKKAGYNFKYVKYDNMHITLKFLGKTNPEILNRLILDTKEQLQHIKPFKLKLCGYGFFPNIKCPNILFISVVPEKALQQIYQKIETALIPLDYKMDKRQFKSHITIARIKKKIDVANLIKSIGNYNFNKYSFNVNKILLYESTLTSEGPIYNEIASFKTKD
jgi:RNA 2',3'-cyclic 3'-phosphodiesterase